MERVFIDGVAVAHPPHRIRQAEAAERIGQAAGARRTAAALARGSRIEGRSIALPAGEIAGLGGIEARNRIYSAIAPGLACEAARDVLPARSPDFLVTSSCTGYVVPGLDVLVAEGLGLACETARLPITEAGCAGGVVALARATDYLRSHPGAEALCVAVELCSLAFHPDGEEGNLTSTLLFGDGAGAAWLHSGPPGEEGIEIVDSASVLVPGTKEAIGFDLSDEGFCPRLSRDLADFLPGPAGALAGRLLARNSLRPEDVSAWLLHPGGPRILERLAQCLGFDRSAARWSWQALAEFGNTSSAAIFDVLRRFRQDSLAPRGWGLVLGFGPGVSIEGLLVRSSVP